MWNFKRRLAGFAAVLAALCLCQAPQAVAAPPKASRAPVDLVDPFIGTTGKSSIYAGAAAEGNVYPGATLPFGFIQVSPDTGPGSGAGGYKIDRPITGFSQQHISGMGGPMFGEVSLKPMTGALANPSHIVSTGKSAESATPGYYAVTLAPWGTRAELTATRHVALHRYTFPAHDTSRILIDVGACLYGSTAGWGSSQPIGGEVRLDAGRREVSGHMLFRGARDERPMAVKRTWKVYFAARFDTPAASFGLWDDAGRLLDGATEGRGDEIGAYLNFKTTPGQVVNVKVAVSFRSVEQARGYFDQEAPGWHFDLARQQAREEWVKALSRIDIEGGTHDQRVQFYTAMYRLHLTPNDWTGESPERYGDGVYYDNILCLWDTFRTVNPMLTLIQPRVQAGIVNTLIRYHQVDGWTGDAHSAHSYEHVQNGSNADVVIADAFVKQLPGIDWRDAYAAIRKNAFVDPNPQETLRPHVGRFRLDDYRRHGYLPNDISSFKPQSVSRTLEYVYNDASVLKLARQHGTPEDVADLEARQHWWRNVWDDRVGFMRGRNKDGSWATPFDPAVHEDAPGGIQYYEGHAWTWSWYVPHDNQGLINKLGGNRAFVKKLTTAVEQYYQPYNEPGMLQTFLFIHAGRPDRTQHYVRKALSHFTSKPDGLPGNDDSATTSTWLMWALLGLYPNAGQDWYYIGSPTFTKATLHLDGGRKLVINAPASNARNKFIRGATLNGKPWHQAWLRHADFIHGGQLDLVMAAKPTAWGAQAPPPSLSAPAR